MNDLHWRTLYCLPLVWRLAAAVVVALGVFARLPVFAAQAAIALQMVVFLQFRFLPAGFVNILSPSYAPARAPEGRVITVAQAVRPGKLSFRIGAPEGRHMSHTYTKNHIHVVFSTRAREKLISKEIQPELWSYLAGICRNVNIMALAIGGIADHHLHALVELLPTMPVSKAVNLLEVEFLSLDERARNQVRVAGRLRRV